jgi:hypothetical protein
LENQVDVEIFLKNSSSTVIATELKQAADDLTWLGQVTVWYQN